MWAHLGNLSFYLSSLGEIVFVNYVRCRNGRVVITVYIRLVRGGPTLGKREFLWREIVEIKLLKLTGTRTSTLFFYLCTFRNFCTGKVWQNIISFDFYLVVFSMVSFLPCSFNSTQLWLSPCISILIVFLFLLYFTPHFVPRRPQRSRYHLSLSLVLCKPVEMLAKTRDRMQWVQFSFVFENWRDLDLKVRRK